MANIHSEKGKVRVTRIFRRVDEMLEGVETLEQLARVAAKGLSKFNLLRESYQGNSGVAYAGLCQAMVAIRDKVLSNPSWAIPDSAKDKEYRDSIYTLFQEHRQQYMDMVDSGRIFCDRQYKRRRNRK